MTITKGVRFNKNELEELMESAKENGLNFSDYIRKMIDFYQKSPSKMNENFELLLQLFERQSEQITKLTDMIIEQRKTLSEHDILIKRIFNQGYYVYRSTHFDKRNQAADPAWKAVSDDIKAQAIEVKF